MASRSTTRATLLEALVVHTLRGIQATSQATRSGAVAVVGSVHMVRKTIKIMATTNGVGSTVPLRTFFQIPPSFNR